MNLESDSDGESNHHSEEEDDQIEEIKQAASQNPNSAVNMASPHHPLLVENQNFVNRLSQSNAPMQRSGKSSICTAMKRNRNNKNIALKENISN